MGVAASASLQKFSDYLVERRFVTLTSDVVAASGISDKEPDDATTQGP
jgi:hypothetical protein